MSSGTLRQNTHPQARWLQGVLVSLAIGLHNIPEGLAVATVLVSRGVGAKKAAWWALFTALPQPLLAVPSFMFVDTFTFLLPLALGFAAGCMTWIVFAELIPDALAAAPHGKVPRPVPNIVINNDQNKSNKLSDTTDNFLT